MRRRILAAALTAVVLAVTLLGVPLAIALEQLIISDERGELERAALQAAVVVPSEGIVRDAIELPHPPGGVHVAVYDSSGQRVAGDGPAVADGPVRMALAGTPASGQSAGELVAAVPVSANEQVVAAARASSARGSLERDVWLARGILLVVAAVATGCAALLARRLARRLAAPIEHLQQTAGELGAGNFAVRAGTSGIGELDRVAGALDTTAERLGQLVERERAFAAYASHQLRTPLTGLRLELDGALHGDVDQLRAATREALVLLDELEATVEDLLAHSRGRSATATPQSVDPLLSAVRQRWYGLLAASQRRLVIQQDDPPVALATGAALRQVLDVLLDNAYRHGQGTVRVVARDSGGALAIDVIDHGSPDGAAPPDPGQGDGFGIAPAVAGSGLGLPLARSLLLADGGRLLMNATPGRTCATILLPAAPSQPPP